LLVMAGYAFANPPLMLNLTLAHAEGVAQLSSSQLANGVGANSSLIRKLLVPLANAGLVHATYGRDGGIRLGRSANSITLREIYCAVIGEKSLWAPRTVPHQCGEFQRRAVFRRACRQADNVVLKTLEHKTLADSLAELRILDAVR
jgi:Rrf2 family transcriptional repressor of oqxAB